MFGVHRLTTPEDCENQLKEHENRKRIWNVDTYLLTAMGEPALLMPFVFTPSKSSSGHLKFDFSATHWAYSYSSNSVDCQICQDLEASVTQNFKADKYEVNQVREQAIRELAAKSMAHNDVKDDHVGLLPILQDGRVVDLKPVLIDLCRMTLEKE